MGDKILLVEDDQDVRALVRILLEDEGYSVVEAGTGTAALELFQSNAIGLVMLDIRLPGIDGFEVCRRLRRSSGVPIIMLTAQDDSHDVVAGLEVGADDYVTKPFNDRELVARVRAQLRRSQGAIDPTDGEVKVGDIVVRRDEARALKNGQAMQLTRTEFNLLLHLVTHPNRVWSRQQLLDIVWGYGYGGDTRLVDTHVARLRSKVETDPGNPTLIVTARGLGYRLEAPGR